MFFACSTFFDGPPPHHPEHPSFTAPVRMFVGPRSCSRSSEREETTKVWVRYERTKLNIARCRASCLGLAGTYKLIHSSRRVPWPILLISQVCQIDVSKPLSQSHPVKRKTHQIIPLLLLATPHIIPPCLQSFKEGYDMLQIHVSSRRLQAIGRIPASFPSRFHAHIHIFL